jgi:hypothetical protein
MTTSALVVVALAADSGTWGQAPSTQPALHRQTRSIEYTKAIRVPIEAFEEGSTALLLPSEPGEFNEDRLNRSRGAIGDLPEEIPLLPEGYVVAAREAVLEESGDWYVARLKADPELPGARPLRILPNPRLELIESILRRSTNDRVFVITGRVTEFQGHNYLLIEVLSERPAAPKETATSPVDTSKPRFDDPGRPEGPAGNELLQKEPSAESVIEGLLGERPLKAVVLPDQRPVAREGDVTEATPNASKSDENAQVGPAWPDETLLADRAGRILASDGGWSFAFENRGDRPDEKPVHVLPNRLLESAIALAAGGSKSVVFLVAGEVTVYNNQNYMLLRKVMVRRDSGNFR